MNVRVKMHSTGEERVIDFYEFEDRIAQGEFKPSDFLCDPAITKGEWRRLEDVRLFHRLSPVAYPPSPRIALQLQKEEQGRKVNEAAALEWEQRRLEANLFFQKEESESQRPSWDEIVYLFLVRCNEQPLTDWQWAIRFVCLPPTLGLLLFVRVSEKNSKWQLVSNYATETSISRLLDKEEAEQVVKAADLLHLEQMPVDEDICGCDGSTWTLELVNQSGHIWRHRWSPLFPVVPPDHPRKLENFVDMCMLLVKLSGQRINIDEMH